MKEEMSHLLQQVEAPRSLLGGGQVTVAKRRAVGEQHVGSVRHEPPLLADLRIHRGKMNGAFAAD